MKVSKRIFAALLAVVMCIGLLPSVAMATDGAPRSSAVIDVLDYGADPSGKNDSTVAVQNALAAAKAKQKELGGESRVTLNFPTGEYKFSKDYATERLYHTSNTSSLSYPTKYVGLLIEDMKNLTVEGNDSVFMMYGDIMAIAIVRSEGTTLQNFVLDYADPDTVDVTVVGQGMDGSKPYVDLYIPANNHYEIISEGTNIQWNGAISEKTGKPYWTDTGTMNAYLVIYKGYDETVRRHGTITIYEGEKVKDADPFIGVQSIVPNGQDTVRITYKDRRPKDQENGNVYLLCNSVRRRTAGAFIWESDKTQVQDIDVHYLSGFGWLTQMSRDTEFNGVNFLPREGTGKYTTSNADQIHVSGAAGYFNVKNCNFSMAHDDPINIHGTYMRVDEVIDSRTLRLGFVNGQQGGYQNFFPGDQVMFYSRTHLESVAHVDENDTFTVASVVDVGEEYEGANLNYRTNIVTFTEDFPEDVLNALNTKFKRLSNGSPSGAEEGLYVAMNYTYSPEVTISGNVMRSIPTRGILCTTPKPVVIENNIFENLAMAGCYLSNDADYWYESGPIRDMTIQNNKFYVRSTGQNEWDAAGPIYIDPVIVKNYVITSGEEPTPQGDPVHRNIKILNNEMHMGDYNVITATGVDGLTFSGNTVVRDQSGVQIGLEAVKNELSVNERVTLDVDFAENTLPSKIFDFRDCKNITLSDNTYGNGFNMNTWVLKNVDGKLVYIADKDLSDYITNEDPQVVLNSKTDPVITGGRDSLKFAVMDPTVLSVDESGVMTGLKEGNTVVLAYYVDGDAIIQSNRIEVTVAGTALDSLTIQEDDNQTIKTTGGKLAFTTDQVDGVKWKVLDARTLQPTDAATIDQGGALTAHADGVVEVVAEKSGASDSKTVIISLPDSYGVKSDTVTEKSTLAEGFAFENEVDTHWAAASETEVGIGTSQAGTILNGGSGTPENLLTYTIPTPDEPDVDQGDMRQAVRAQVDITNYQNSINGGAALMLFDDMDNYVSVGVNSGFMSPKIVATNEKAGIGTTKEATAEAITEATAETAMEASAKSIPGKITVEIFVNDKGATVRYKETGTDSWKEIATFTPDQISLTKETMKVGFYVNQPLMPDTTQTSFSNFKFAMGRRFSSENSFRDNVDVLPFFSSLAGVLDPTLILADSVGILNKNNANWDGTGKPDEIKVTSDELGDGPTSVKNIITYDVPAELEQDLRVQATIDGPIKSGVGSYGGMHLMLLKGDNFIRIGTRSHFSGIRLDTQYGGNIKVEGEAFSENPTGTKVTYEIEKIENNFKVRYKNAGGEWSAPYTSPITGTFPSDYKIGMVAYTHTGEPITAVLSDLKIAQASLVTTEELEAQDAVPLMTSASNSAPTVSELTLDKSSCAVGDTVTASYTYADTDGHAEGTPLYRWESGGNTVFTEMASYIAAKAGDVTCTVYVFDQYGKPCETPATATFTVTGSAPGGDDETTGALAAIYVDGSKVDGLEKGVYDYSYKLPAELTSVALDWTMANGQGAVELQKADGTPITGKVVSLADLGTIPTVKLVYKEDGAVKATYTLKLQPIQSNDTTARITVDGTPLGDSHLIKAGFDSYFISLTNGQNVVPIAVSAPEGAKVSVWRSFYRNPIANAGASDHEFTANVDLYSGLNIFNIDVTAADGATVTHYRAQVFRTGSSAADASFIKLNGILLEAFSPSTLEYTLDVTPEQARSLKIEAGTDSMDATVSITQQGGYPRYGSSATVTLDKPMNPVVVTVRAENLIPRHYTLTLHVPTDTNADLSALSLSDSLDAPISLSDIFTPEARNYTAQYTGKTLRVKAQAQETGAKLTLIAENQQRFPSETNTIDQEVTLYKGSNDLELIVTAPDGVTSKTYHAVVTATDFVYVSDLPEEQWLTNVAGYGSNQRNRSLDGNPIRVLVDGVSTEFAKGVGSHATSNITIDLTDKGYTRFQALAGIDQEMTGTAASVKFIVMIDNHEVWNSDAVLRDSDDAKVVDIEIPADAKKLTLYADANGSNANDHADWADAKFSDPTLANEALPDAKITEVAVLEGLRVPTGTTAQQLNLPDMVDVTLDNGRKGPQSVTWVMDEFDGSKAGTYTLEGSFTNLPANILNPDGLKAKITVTVYVPDSGSTPSGGGSSSAGNTVKNPDGSTTKTVTDKKTGAVTETTTYPDGTKIVATTPKDGETSIEVSVPSGKKEVTVTIPTTGKPKAGVVAAIVKEDGAKEIIKNSVATENGLRVTLTGSAKLVLLDNSKTFTDVASDHWAADAVQFAASRELFTGTGANTFSPASNMTRGMLMTVLARLSGQDTAGGDAWYSAGMDWAKEQGISDGTAPEADITRESLVVMLYRYAGNPEADESRRVKDAAPYGEFSDADKVSDWAEESMRWAVANGILTGKSGSLLDPQGAATRAEVSAMLMRFVALPA